MDIYVGNLPYQATDPDLQELFEQYGAVSSARVILDRMSGRSKGFGFVEMPEKSEGQAAIDALNGADLMGRAIRVNESQPKPAGERRPSGGGGGYGGGGGGGGYGGGGGGGGRW
ncbi:MAG: RNA-binding protein [Verrucomicrobia bacterium]|nr:RNA-binding protein [Verrucomicrobiota bacterium]